MVLLTEDIFFFLLLWNANSVSLKCSFVHSHSVSLFSYMPKSPFFNCCRLTLNCDISYSLCSFLRFLAIFVHFHFHIDLESVGESIHICPPSKSVWYVFIDHRGKQASSKYVIYQFIRRAYTSTYLSLIFLMSYNFLSRSVVKHLQDLFLEIWYFWWYVNAIISLICWLYIDMTFFSFIDFVARKITKLIYSIYKFIYRIFEMFYIPKRHFLWMVTFSLFKFIFLYIFS